MRFHAVVVFGLSKNLLFESVLGHCFEYVKTVKFTKILHCAENVAWFVPKEWKGMDYFFTEPFYGQLSGGGLWPRGFIALFSICWIPSRSFI